MITLMQEDNLLKEYERIESDIKIHHHTDDVTYTAPVNFNESMEAPRHRWFPYKEGFSPSFVRNFLEEQQISEHSWILDPFSGVGTTVLESISNGHSAVGFDVSPLTIFISRTKLIQVSKKELRELGQLISELRESDLRATVDPPSNKTVISYFSSEYLAALLKVKAFFLKINNFKLQSLFKLAFLSVIETFSTHRKAGNGLKRKSNSKQQSGNMFGDEIFYVKNAVIERVKLFEKDLQQTQSGTRSEFIYGSSLDSSNYSDLTFDAVLTSPPYANCFDYSKIYMCELWLGDFFFEREDQKAFRMNSVRSHVHATWPERHQEHGSSIVQTLIERQLSEKELWSKRIPSMVSGYFKDIGKLLDILKDRLSVGAPLGFVVANSIYGGVPVATDLLIAELAREKGYIVDGIDVYRRIIPSSQQYVLLNENKKFLRESLVIIKWEG